MYDKKIPRARTSELPDTPGVYFFLDKNAELLYIGKATSLRDRVRSYFAGDLIETRGPKIALMLEKIHSIGYRSTDSVLEALLLESRLIKRYQPLYNTDAKDDKSYNHIVITKEAFPRVLVVRGRDLDQGKFTDPIKYLYGPFPGGGMLREAMRIVRRIFPFRDKCTPYDALSEKQKEKSRPCFSEQLGLCPGVCIGTVSRKEYTRTINHIRLLFEGRKSSLVASLKREMKSAAKRLDFERANELKKTLFSLQHIQDVSLLKAEESHAFDAQSALRIEAYDVAHLYGEASVGVMTVIEHGRPDKDEYRMFRLRKEHRGNDLSALSEVIMRRLKHPEWKMPDIVAVDGSFLQLGIAEKIFAERKDFQPLLVGVVKDERHQPKDIINLPSGLADMRADILLANSEAHRFAISYHRKRRGMEFLR